MALNISDEVKVQMPMKTVASLIAMVAIGTWAFFGIQEKLNQHSTQIKIMENAVTLEVPNKVDYEVGDNWGDIYD